MDARRTSRRWKVAAIAAVCGTALYAGTADATPATPVPGYVPSTLAMATHSLFNMVGITAVSGAVLLALLAAKHF